MTAETLGDVCPSCHEPWLRPTNLPGRYRCVNCLHRFELRSVCPNCGEHSTIVRMSSTALYMCGHCQVVDAHANLDMLKGIAPSILAADFGRLSEQVQTVLDAGAPVIHVDVMDGHFVPPITMGPLAVDAIKAQVAAAGAKIDVHLMIERPERQIEAFAQAGADSITIHAEATPHLHYTLQAIAAAAACPAWRSTRARPPRRSPSSSPTWCCA